MKQAVGFLLILIGILLGFYVGIWLCFIGGIIQVIEAIRAENLIAMDVAFGVARIFFAGLCGTISGYCFVLPGAVMFND